MKNGRVRIVDGEFLYIDRILVADIDSDGESFVDHDGRQWWPGEFDKPRSTSRGFADRGDLVAFALEHADALLEQARKSGAKPVESWRVRPSRPPPVDNFDKAEPIHEWFGLSYSSYLVVPRSMLQSMPPDWQRRLVGLIEEMRQRLDVDDAPSTYTVLAREGKRFVSDPYREYERGRRRVPVRRKARRRAA